MNGINMDGLLDEIKAKESVRDLRAMSCNLVKAVKELGMELEEAIAFLPILCQSSPVTIPFLSLLIRKYWKNPELKQGA